MNSSQPFELEYLGWDGGPRIVKGICGLGLLPSTLLPISFFCGRHAECLHLARAKGPVGTQFFQRIPVNAVRGYRPRPVPYLFSSLRQIELSLWSHAKQSNPNRPALANFLLLCALPCLNATTRNQMENGSRPRGDGVKKRRASHHRGRKKPKTTAPLRSTVFYTEHSVPPPADIQVRTLSTMCQMFKSTSLIIPSHKNSTAPILPRSMTRMPRLSWRRQLSCLFGEKRRL